MAWEDWDLEKIPHGTLEWITRYPNTVRDFINDALAKVKDLEAEIEELKKGV